MDRELIKTAINEATEYIQEVSELNGTNSNKGARILKKLSKAFFSLHQPSITTNIYWQTNDYGEDELDIELITDEFWNELHRFQDEDELDKYLSQFD